MASPCLFPRAGFSVHGVVKPGETLRKSGLQPGHALLLTKPVGTGVVFAADMRGKAPGLVVEAALGSMAQQSGKAAAVLRAHGCTAATDVTGFGLLGHLARAPSGAREPRCSRLLWGRDRTGLSHYRVPLRREATRGQLISAFVPRCSRRTGGDVQGVRRQVRADRPASPLLLRRTSTATVTFGPPVTAASVLTRGAQRSRLPLAGHRSVSNRFQSCLEQWSSRRAEVLRSFMALITVSLRFPNSALQRC